MKNGCLVACNLGDNLILCLLEIGLLSLNDNTKALLNETRFFDSEVHNGHLGGNLWGVMRVTHSGGDVQLEFSVVLNFFVSDSNTEVSAYLDQSFVKDVIQNWIHILSNIKEEDLFSMNDTLLNLLDKVGILVISNDNLVAACLLDPVHGLSLRVDVQGPS